MSPVGLDGLEVVGDGGGSGRAECGCWYFFALPHAISYV